MNGTHKGYGTQRVQGELIEISGELIEISIGIRQ